MKRFSKILGVLICVLLTTNIAYADRPLVVLDAGHGGMDSGAVSQDGEYLEKVWNLETTKSCKETLEKYGAYNAANLDGGQSTSLVINNKLVNSPNYLAKKQGGRYVVTGFGLIP